MRAMGGDIKSTQERRMMADHKRFKQHREFRERLEENPEERVRKPERRNPFAPKGNGREERQPFRGHKHGESRGEFHEDRRKGFHGKGRDEHRGGGSRDRNNRRNGFYGKGFDERRSRRDERGGFEQNDFDNDED